MQYYRAFQLLMAIILSAVIVSCNQSLSSILYGQFKDVRTTYIDGLNREYIVQLPSDYDSTTAYPLVIAFHGTGQDAERAWELWGWKEKGENEDFITVYPQGLLYNYYTDDSRTNSEWRTKWMDGAVDTLLTAGQTLRSDVDFVELMMTELHADFNIDTNEQFVTGFSNGGNFTWRLAMEMPDYFKGFGPFAGRLALPNPNPIELRSVFLGIGNEDDFIELLNGGQPLAMNQTDVLTLFQPFTDDIVTPLELTDTPDLFAQGGTFITLKWDDNSGAGTNYYQLSVLEGTEHVYPSRLNSWGNPHNFHSADVYWDFFQSL